MGQAGVASNQPERGVNWGPVPGFARRTTAPRVEDLRWEAPSLPPMKNMEDGNVGRAEEKRKSLLPDWLVNWRPSTGEKIEGETLPETDVREGLETKEALTTGEAGLEDTAPRPLPPEAIPHDYPTGRDPVDLAHEEPGKPDEDDTGGIISLPTIGGPGPQVSRGTSNIGNTMQLGVALEDDICCPQEIDISTSTLGNAAATVSQALAIAAASEEEEPSQMPLPVFEPETLERPVDNGVMQAQPQLDSTPIETTEGPAIEDTQPLVEANLYTPQKVESDTARSDLLTFQRGINKEFALKIAHLVVTDIKDALDSTPSSETASRDYGSIPLEVYVQAVDKHLRCTALDLARSVIIACNRMFSDMAKKKQISAPFLRNWITAISEYTEILPSMLFDRSWLYFGSFPRTPEGADLIVPGLVCLDHHTRYKFILACWLNGKPTLSEEYVGRDGIFDRVLERAKISKDALTGPLLFSSEELINIYMALLDCEQNPDFFLWRLRVMWRGNKDTDTMWNVMTYLYRHGKLNDMVIGAEVKAWSKIDPHFALRLVKHFKCVRLEGSFEFVTACINCSKIPPDTMLTLLNRETAFFGWHNGSTPPRKVAKREERVRVSASRAKLVHHMATCYADASHLSPRRALAKVHQCYTYLVMHRAPRQSELSRALVHAGFTRYCEAGRHVSIRQLMWILSVVEQIEGYPKAEILARNIIDSGPSGHTGLKAALKTMISRRKAQRRQSIISLQPSGPAVRDLPSHRQGYFRRVGF